MLDGWKELEVSGAGIGPWKSWTFKNQEEREPHGGAGPAKKKGEEHAGHFRSIKELPKNRRKRPRAGQTVRKRKPRSKKGKEKTGTQDV